MENASKALLIAGSIFLAMITISIFYFIFNRAGTMSDEVTEDYNQKELIAFNKSFEAYNKKIMYGSDLVSLINKAIDNNKNWDVEYHEHPVERRYLPYFVNIIFTYDGRTYNMANQADYEAIRNEFINNIDSTEDYMHEFKFTIFRCSNISYVEESDIQGVASASALGRVKEMQFVVN